MTPSTHKQAVDSSPAPFTEDQVEYLTEVLAQHDSLVEARNNRHLRRFRRYITASIVILTIGVSTAFYVGEKDRQARRADLAAGITSIVHTGRVVSVVGCNRDYEARVVTRSQLLRALALTKRQFRLGKLPADQYKVAQRYYKEQLALAKPLDCRPSATLVTDDPRDLPPVPEPLHGRDITPVGTH